MKIFVLEDDLKAMNIVPYLREQGHHTVNCASNLLDAAYLLEENPGIDYYDVFLFDASVPKEKLSCFGHKAYSFGSKYGFAGMEFIVENYDIFQNKRVAIVSAFRQNLFEMIKADKKYSEIVSNLLFIDKSSDWFLRTLADFLKM